MWTDFAQIKVQARETKAAKFCAAFSQQGDPLEALELADGLLDTGAAFLKSAREELGPNRGILTVRDKGTDAAPACRAAVGFGFVTLVADYRAQCDIRADVEQGLEIAAVAGLAAGQVEGQGQAVEIAFQVDLGGKSTA